MSAEAKESLITAEELAAMEFAPLSPPFRLPPGERNGWLESAGNEFPYWVLIQTILSLDDKALAEKCRNLRGSNAALLDELARVADRWEEGAEVARNAELRLSCALHRVAAS